MNIPLHQVRASYTDETITVYQAYSAEIAVPALAAGRFVAPFNRERMTWIKPSWLWMMYRSGWATKPGQEHILAVEILRSGFEFALAQACLSQFDCTRYPDRRTWSRLLRSSPVRVQWDPERSLRLAPLPYRSLQVGLSGTAVHDYVDDWIVELRDVTWRAHAIRERLATGDERGAAGLLPTERCYPLPLAIGAAIGADPTGSDAEGVSHLGQADQEPVNDRAGERS